VYVYDSLRQYFQRKPTATAPPEDELARQARERMRRGEPALPEAPPERAPEEEVPPRPGDQRSRGRPLTPAVRSDMEDVFDEDLSHVRVHSDDAAREGARRIGAEAYTVRSHIYFGPSREPGVGNAELLAHELTHVLQQEAGSGVAPRGSEAEREAEHAARRVKRGEKPKPVRKRRSGEMHRSNGATTPSPSAPAAAGATPAGAGPGGGAGPHQQFTETQLRQILQNPADPQLQAAIQQLKTREQLWAQAKQKAWDSQTKQFKDRNFVRMRLPGPNYLPRKSVMGSMQLEVGDYLLRHGEERTDDKERNQSKLSRLMYGQAPLPAGAMEFSRSPQGTRAALTFPDVLGRYQAWQQATYQALGTGNTPSDNIRTLDSTQAAQNLQLSETGARLLAMRNVNGVEQGPFFNFTGGRWNRIAAEPTAAAPAGAGLPAATGTADASGPGSTTAATQSIMVADYQAHHVIPLWLASQSGKVSGDELTNLAPWHRNAHQTNHAFHHGVPTEIQESTTATDYRDFPAGTRFIISALEGGNAAHPAPVPAVALTADEQWVASPQGAAWMG
jgi:hypothetical protein